jgi:hypothetical protein
MAAVPFFVDASALASLSITAANRGAAPMPCCPSVLCLCAAPLTQIAGHFCLVDSGNDLPTPSTYSVIYWENMPRPMSMIVISCSTRWGHGVCERSSHVGNSSLAILRRNNLLGINTQFHQKEKRAVNAWRESRRESRVCANISIILADGFIYNISYSMPWHGIRCHCVLFSQ